MGMREKDQADFDLETFVDLFDTAMSSDNPAVQRALKNLVLISAIVNAQQNTDSIRKGPLRRVIDDIQILNKRIGQLESAGSYRSTYAPSTPSPGTAIPGIYQPSQTQWPTTLPGTIPPGTIISGTSAGDNFSASAMTQIDVRVGSLLDKLEAK
jgi:hypothetical protein